MEDNTIETQPINTSEEVLDTPEAEAKATEPEPTLAEKMADSKPKTLKEKLQKAPEVAPATDKPAWTPNFKYTFDGAEKELDEFLRPLAKDDETLKKIIDIAQRAEAVEMHKTKSKKYEEEIGSMKPTLETVAKLQALYQSGSMENHERVLESLGYDDDLLFKIAQMKLQRNQLPAEQKALYEEKRQAVLDKERLLTENEQYRSQANQELALRTSYEMDTELGKAEYQGLKALYEKANGSGSFKEFVRTRGAYLVDQAGRHVPPSEVVAMIAKEFAPFMAQQAQGPEGSGVQVVQQEKPKVIPNVGRSGGSPAKTAVTSIAQLRQLQKQTY